VIVRVDQSAGAGCVLEIEIVDRGEGVDPTVLREVVVVESGAGAEDSGCGSIGRVSDANARGKRLPVIVRNTGEQRAAGGLQRGEGGIRGLVAAGGDEQTKGGVVAQAGIDSEGGCYSPGVFCVQAEAADALRKSAVAGSGRIFCGAARKIGIGSGGKRIWTIGENGGIGGIETGILRIGEQRFSVA